MIHYLKHNEINKKQWDKTIAESANGLIYACSWYLDLACPEWDALVEDDYKKVMPLTRKKKYGIQYLFPPYFIQQLGVFSINKISKEIVNEFLKSIPANFRFIEMNLNTENNFDWDYFSSIKNLTHHLLLQNNYQKIYSAYSDNLKRNLKKAVKENIQITNDVSVSEIVKLFRANRGVEIENLKSSHYHTFEKICIEVEKRKLLHKSGVYFDGKLISGLIVFEFSGKFILIFSGVNPTGKNKSAMHFLIDNFIKTHSGTNYIFDFEGSNNAMLARFYKSFGAVEKIYLQIKKNNLPAPVKWLKGQ